MIRLTVGPFLHVTFRIQGSKQSKIHAKCSGSENYLGFQYIWLHSCALTMFSAIVPANRAELGHAPRELGHRDDLFNWFLFSCEAAPGPRWAQWSC